MAMSLQSFLTEVPAQINDATDMLPASAVKSRIPRKSFYHSQIRKSLQRFDEYRNLFIEENAKKQAFTKERYEFFNIPYCKQNKTLFSRCANTVKSALLEKCPVCITSRMEPEMFRIQFSLPDCGHLICAPCYGKLQKVNLNFII